MEQVYKQCDCGHLNIFDKTDSAPRNCGKCKRKIVQKPIFPLSEYVPPEEKNEEFVDASDAEEIQENPEAIFKLVDAANNIELILPMHDTVILGREGLGAEYFQNNISRRHLYITPKGRIGISVTDKESMNGVMIKGEVLPKNTERLVLPDTEITLDIIKKNYNFILHRI